jgi:hypothetical protein
MTRLEALKHRISHCKTATELQELLEDEFGCVSCKYNNTNCVSGGCINGHDDYYSEEWSK